ncbi:FMN-dependent NADH-azoreductase [Halomonas sp. AOP12-C2-37]|uniref:FMN-dependent NADH-azoreductase n=1 Tax=unclassified Halomonas TaxID=2609666 RepID=UPI003F8DFEF1
MKLLHIKVSQNINGSTSRKASDHLLSKLKVTYPQLVETVLDLSMDPLPHLDAVTISAFSTDQEERSEEQKQAVLLSDRLVDMLLDTDVIVISSPMWNLGLPSVLKAWFDHITRAGRTFGFTEKGSKIGLVIGKKVYTVVSSGSIFSSGLYVNDDLFTPYIKTALAYVGITDVIFFRVDGTHDPLSRATALPIALSTIDQLNLQKREHYEQPCKSL